MLSQTTLSCFGVGSAPAPISLQWFSTIYHKYHRYHKCVLLWCGWIRRREALREASGWDCSIDVIAPAFGLDAHEVGQVLTAILVFCLWRLVCSLVALISRSFPVSWSPVLRLCDHQWYSELITVFSVPGLSLVPSHARRRGSPSLPQSASTS